MRTRWLTFILIVSLLIPVSALGSVRHSCGMDFVPLQGNTHQEHLKQSAPADNSEATLPCCHIRAVPEQLPAANAVSKVQFDAPQLADVPTAFSSPFRLPNILGNILPTGVRFHSFVSGPPLFIRICSLLN
jgi:hypothetical protein